MNKLVFCISLGAVFFFVGCGDDSSPAKPSLEDSSTSSKVTKPAEVKTGIITDARDGKSYKTVTIGSQTWMAQNLNYETANSYCNNDSTKYCEKYGRLYTWAAAMDSAGTWSTNGKGCGYGSTCLPTGTVQGVCPVGWHLPSRDEFEALFTAVGGQSAAGKVLKSTSGWSDLGNGSSGNGTDAYSFSVLPAGNRNDRGEYYFSEGYNARFWNSTEFDSNNAYGVHLYYGNDNVFLDYVSKYLGYSVRCIKDD